MRLLTLLFVLIGYKGVAQIQTEIINIHFPEKRITQQPGASSLRKADYVQIRIDSIPRKSYVVSIGKKDSIISIGTPPALFSALSFGDSYTKLLANLADFTIGAVVPVAGDVGAEDAIDVTETSELGEMMMMSEHSDHFGNPIRNRINPLMATMMNMRHSLFDAYYNFKYLVIDSADILLLNYNLQRVPNCDSFLNSVNRIITRRNHLSQSVEQMYVGYYDTILPKFDTVAQSIPLLKADSMIQHYRKDFFTFLGKFDSAFNRNLIPKACAVLNAPPRVDTFLSLPYPLRGKDINTLSIKITPLDTSKDKQGYETEIPLYHTPDRFWAFTSGVYVGSLSSEQYSFRANTRQQPGVTPAKYDTLSYTLLADEKDKVQAGISALLHVGSYFTNSNWGWHFAVGPGLSLESKPRPRILIGAGLVCGRHDKITLTAAWIGGPVKTLKTAYQVNGEYQGAPTDIMKDSFKSGFAVSLGYALFGK